MFGLKSGMRHEQAKLTNVATCHFPTHSSVSLARDGAALLLQLHVAFRFRGVLAIPSTSLSPARLAKLAKLQPAGRHADFRCYLSTWAAKLVRVAGNK